jgi:hypothetical protein
MRLRGFLIIIMIAIVSTIPVSAKMQPRFWVGGKLGVSTYAMDDMNDYIKWFNNYYELALDKINGGFSYGIEAGMQLNSSLGFYVGYENLSATASVDEVAMQIEFKYPVDAIYGGVQYAVWKIPNWNLGFAGDIGSASMSGKRSFYFEGSDVNTFSEAGSDIFCRIRVFADYKASKIFIISPSIGYRFGKISEFTENGEVAYKTKNSKMSLDFSGVLINLAVKFVINPEK